MSFILLRDSIFQITHRRKQANHGFCLALLLFNLMMSSIYSSEEKYGYRGWSTWSLQAYKGVGYGFDWANEANVKAQADTLAEEFGKYGFNQINLDSGWADLSLDEFGRRQLDRKKYQSGIKSFSRYLSGKGLGLGLYYLPGIDSQAVHNKTRVLGTNYTADEIVKCAGIQMSSQTTVSSGCRRPPANAFNSGYALDYEHPGAQAYVDSIVDQLYDWGVNFVKIDGNVPGSSVDSQDRNFTGTRTDSDLLAWRQAVTRLHQSHWVDQGREEIWISASWELPPEQADLLRKTVDAWRVATDIEAYSTTMTTFDRVIRNARAGALWTSVKANRGPGLLDMDSVVIANMTLEECQTMVTLWALVGSPLYLGDDLTRLPIERKALLKNEDVLRVQRLSASNPAVLIGYDQSNVQLPKFRRLEIVSNLVVDEAVEVRCHKTRLMADGLGNPPQLDCPASTNTIESKKQFTKSETKSKPSTPKPSIEWQRQIWYAEHLDLDQIFIGVVNAGLQSTTDGPKKIKVNLKQIASTEALNKTVASIRDAWKPSRVVRLDQKDGTMEIDLKAHESCLLVLNVF